MREDVDLLALRSQFRAGCVKARIGLIDAGAGLLRVLHRAGADTGEVVVAIQFLPGEGHFSLGRHHRSLRLSDHRSLTLQRRLGVLQLRPGDQGLRIRRLGRSAQIAIIDQRQQLPRLHLLVVFHQHFLDEPGHARHHQCVVGGNECIVSVLLSAFAEQAGHRQIHQHANSQCGRHSHREFLLCLSRHGNLHFQYSNQVGARGGKIRVGSQKISRISVTATPAMHT